MTAWSIFPSNSETLSISSLVRLVTCWICESLRKPSQACNSERNSSTLMGCDRRQLGLTAQPIDT